MDKFRTLPPDPRPTQTVSVIICAYTDERWDLLNKAVQSVLAQSYPVTELIICIDHNDALASKCRGKVA